MVTHEKRMYIGMLSGIRQNSSMEFALQKGSALGTAAYDPELLYVECHVCGKPLLWEQGKTTELLLAAGVDISKLDERCMIVSEGCPTCDPYAREGYTLAVVRIAGVTPEEAVYMSRPGGQS